MKKLISVILVFFFTTSCTTVKFKEQGKLDTPSNQTKKISRYKVIGGIVKDTKTKSSSSSDKEKFAKGVHFYSGGYHKSYSYYAHLVRTGL